MQVKSDLYLCFMLILLARRAVIQASSDDLDELRCQNKKKIVLYGKFWPSPCGLGSLLKIRVVIKLLPETHSLPQFFHNSKQVHAFGVQAFIQQPHKKRQTSTKKRVRFGTKTAAQLWGSCYASRLKFMYFSRSFVPQSRHQLRQPLPEQICCGSCYMAAWGYGFYYILCVDISVINPSIKMIPVK